MGRYQTFWTLNLVAQEVTTGLYKVDNFGIMNYELLREVLQCREFAEIDNRVFFTYNNRSRTLVPVLKEERRPHLCHRRGWSHSVYVILLLGLRVFKQKLHLLPDAPSPLLDTVKNLCLWSYSPFWSYTHSEFKFRRYMVIKLNNVECNP